MDPANATKSGPATKRKRERVHTAKLELRCTPAEKAAWQAKANAAGTTLSDLLRQAAGRVNTWTAPDRQVEQERVRQLARIGRNLNQIAKWANTYQSSADAVVIIGLLMDLEQLIKETQFKRTHHTAPQDQTNDH